MRFALPVFLGSALLFCIEPMLGRTLLPLFGGTAAVWTVCLVAYQLLLLVGAVYADRISHTGRRFQRALHLALLLASAAWVLGFALKRHALGVAIPPSGGAWGESGSALLCVLAAIGLPFAVLSAGSSLLQKWAEEREGRGRETYRLYVVSNVGSFAGLLLYPLVLEPYVSLHWQWLGGAIGFAVYTAMCAVAAQRGGNWQAARAFQQVGAEKRGTGNGEQETEQLRRTEPANQDEGTTASGQQQEGELGNRELGTGNEAITWDGACGSGRDTWGKVLLWLALPALSPALLNATTTHLSTDVSPFPMMWVILLGAFLLTYSIGFSRTGERLLPLWLALAAAAVWFAIKALKFGEGNYDVFSRNFIAGVALIFFGGCFLHAWLCRIRPGTRHITAYYLCISLGGAIGGFLSGIVPVLAFDTVKEYPIAILLLVAAILLATATVLGPAALKVARLFKPGYEFSPMQVGAAFCAVMLVALAAIAKHQTPPYTKLYARGRNFYGCWSVTQGSVNIRLDMPDGFERPKYPITILQNGNTSHGIEPESDLLRTEATAYYGPFGGGLAFTLHAKYAETNAPMSVGIVGMGAGTQAWYGRKGDKIRFYEINPAVVNAANEHFTFIKRSKAEISVVVADARKALEGESAANEEKYDVLVVDAYSGDSVPFHLITRQAFELYASRVKEDGILALHISNWHIDLFPICKAAARHLDMKALGTIGDKGLFTWSASWVFLSRQELSPPDEGVSVIKWDSIRDVPLPDDEKGSILPYIKFHR